MTRLLLIALCLCLLALPARAEDDSALWMARCMVAEAGWTAVTDHLAIGYVLIRRWEQLGRRITLARLIRQYCAGLGEHARPSPRQRWILELNEAGDAPAHFPKNERWSATQKYWTAALQRARLVLAWQLPDPCHGEAMHWSAKGRAPAAELYPVDCGPGIVNAFFGIRRKGTQ